MLKPVVQPFCCWPIGAYCTVPVVATMNAKTANEEWRKMKNSILCSARSLRLSAHLFLRRSQTEQPRPGASKLEGRRTREWPRCSTVPYRVRSAPTTGFISARLADCVPPATRLHLLSQMKKSPIVYHLFYVHICNRLSK